ncbi:MAG: 5'-nucleotidase [bacterium]
MKAIHLKAAAALLAAALAACTPLFSADEGKTENPSEVGETLLGDVVADAMRAASGADAAFINAGSLGAYAEPGKITPENLRVYVPFENEPVVTLKLTGGELLAALERSVSLLPRRFSGFLQVSGIGFTCDLNEAPGGRVAAATIRGKPIAPDAEYTVAATGFLAGGGGGYATLRRKREHVKEIAPLGETVLKHADAQKSKKTTGRIVIIEREAGEGSGA